MYTRFWPLLGVLFAGMLLAYSIFREARREVYEPFFTPSSRQGEMTTQTTQDESLPTHPLYQLRMIQQRLRLWTMLDVKQRAQQKLVYAMERHSASQQLVDTNPGLALTTAMKGHHYLLQTVGILPPELKQMALRAVVVEEQTLDLLSEVATDEHRAIIDRMKRELAVVKEAVQ